ncbi:protein PPP1R35 homolog [Zeugodacus cucurbitae]|uniref:protein PPP1R35 homolog n=1 Tax=Zeugodacus cucurbitae TaxID=28588 RepID=UPI0023D94129|nr:protein PPP1R35 homolog [Zeugodacus cucurbitae]
MSNYQRKSVNNVGNKKTMSGKNETNSVLKAKCIKNRGTNHGEKPNPSNHHVAPIEEAEICRNERKYKTPQMNTILRDVNQIENVQSLRPPVLNKDIDLTPRSKAAIAPKVTQKLNFNTDQVVFKNLTPINVNDSILIQKQCSANPNKYKKINKTPSPDLCHWLDPLPALKHTIPEPEITLEFCEIEIDPFECYLRLLN